MLMIIGCSDKPAEQVVLKAYPIDSLDGLLTQDGVEFDSANSADGNGSIKIIAPESTTVLLYETGDIDQGNTFELIKD